jgi:hypothetical protein
MITITECIQQRLPSILVSVTDSISSPDDTLMHDALVMHRTDMFCIYAC